MWVWVGGAEGLVGSIEIGKSRSACRGMPGCVYVRTAVCRGLVVGVCREGVSADAEFQKEVGIWIYKA